MSRALLVMMWFFLAVSVGCEEPVDSCEVATQFAPSLAVGVGLDSFTALEHGDKVQIAYGLQGGQHIWMAVQTAGVAPGALHRTDVAAPEIRYELLGDGQVLGQGINEMPLQGDVSFAESAGDTLLLDWFDAAEYEELIVRVTLEDACGTTLVEQRTIRL